MPSASPWSPLLIVIVSLYLVPVAAADFNSVTVFRNGADGYKIFRIPAIIQAAMLAVIVLISMYAELTGSYSVGNKMVAVTSMVLWLTVPLLIIWRMMKLKRGATHVVATPVK